MQSEDWPELLAPPDEVAQRLIGCYVIRELQGKRLVGKIVETEAYDQSDAASHSYKGNTPRTSVMFGPAGHLYVYFTYGMHYCMNVVTGTVGHGSGVLIRALEPIEGLEIMSQHRHDLTGKQLTNGPAKLCQALAVDKRFNGHDLRSAPLRLKLQPPVPRTAIVQTTRVGISSAKDVPWRFYMKDSLYVSKR